MALNGAGSPTIGEAPRSDGAAAFPPPREGRTDKRGVDIAPNMAPPVATQLCALLEGLSTAGGPFNGNGARCVLGVKIVLSEDACEMASVALRYQRCVGNTRRRLP